MAQKGGGRQGMNRRNFLIYGGMSAVAGLAGCTGGSEDRGDGGGGGSGSDGADQSSGGDSDSSDGDGGASGDTTGNGDDGGQSKTETPSSSSDMQEVVVGLPPGGYWGVIKNELDSRGILESKMGDVGASLTFQRTWDDVPLFAAGKTHIGHFAGLESVRLGPQREMELTLFGKIVPMFLGFCVKTDGPYDPDNTGSVQASLDQLAQDNGKIGHNGFASPDTLVYDAIMHQAYGYRLSEESQDFNPIQSDPFAQAKLLNQGNLDAASTGLVNGTDQFIKSPPAVKPLFWGHDKAAEVGFGTPALENLTMRTEYFNNNQEIAQAYLDSWREGMRIFHDDPVGIATKNQTNIEAMGVDSAEAAEFIVSFGMKLRDHEGIPPVETPHVYENPDLTDAWIEGNIAFHENLAAAGLLTQDWDGWVQYKQL